jgi:hypothetical protein
MDFERELLITGCGSSGTTYISRLLQINGLDTSHDSGYGKDAVVTNACNGKEIYVYEYEKFGIRDYVKFKVNLKEFNRVIHLVRNPIETIPSVMAKWRSWGGIWLHVKENLEELDDSKEVSIRNAMAYWIYWNKNIQEVADIRFKFEDLLEDPSPLFQYIGSDYSIKMDNKTKIGSAKKKRKTTFKELLKKDHELAVRLKELAQEYGYDL